MKVILLQNIKGFGRTGDIKNVSDGHARNFLLPKNMAKSATEGALKEAETLKKKLEKSNKEVYLFLSNNINPAEFENFPIDCWVNTACPRLDFDSRKIINAGDLKI